MEWSDQLAERLRTLWGEGHSSAEIGRRLGVSKNSVVGKAHRLDLSSRPSPIRPAGSGQPRASYEPRAQKTTLAPLPSYQPPPIVAAPVVIDRPRVTTAADRALPVAPQPVAAPKPYGRVITCCWPIGEPGTRSFRFCDATSVPGKPYCGEHVEIAYVKIRERREDSPVAPASVGEPWGFRFGGGNAA